MHSCIDSSAVSVLTAEEQDRQGTEQSRAGQIRLVFQRGERGFGWGRDWAAMGLVRPCRAA